MIDVIWLKTKIVFGENAADQLGPTLRERGLKRAMLVIGGGSVYKNGAYDDAVRSLKKAKVAFFEYKGVKPNPDAKHTYGGGLLARSEKADCVIALGGGSVCDAAKVMAILAANPAYRDCWSYVLDQSRAKNPALPVFSVITTAGTASENNSGSVITNAETTEKRGVFTPSATPAAAFMDPKYTYTIPAWHTASGIFDCFSHLLEQYYGEPSFEWTRQYILAHLRTLIRFAPIAVKKPTDPEARANVMITTTMALNGIASFRSGTDWNVHAMEHAVSALWDVTHGAGLALITPTYIEYRCGVDAAFKKQTQQLARELFGLKVKTIPAFLKALRAFIKKIGLPAKFTDFPEIKSVSQKDRDFLHRHVMRAPGDEYTPAESALIRAVLDRVPA